MQPIFFTNKYEIIDQKFQEMIDKMIISQAQTDDYELRKMIKHILAKDYYDYAVSWLEKFRDAEWWKEDLT